MSELNYPLANLTSWHIGGRAERFFAPSDLSALQGYLSTLPLDIPVTYLGLGSNVLIRDEGIAGSVILTRGLQSLAQRPEGTIYVEAGVACAKLARFACRLGLSDAAFFAGIPGTVGGALAMNAGAFGGETWEWVKSVGVLDRQGNLIVRSPKEYHISYRTVLGPPNEVFVWAEMQFPPNAIDGLERIRSLLRKRAETQPIGTFNCGSVFRNPQGEFAAKLIEASDLKGYRIGDAMVSEKHANFIINIGQARADDVIQLIEKIQATVSDKWQITLHPEVRILG